MAESRNSGRALVIAAVMASMSMIAIEMTIVSTAMPQIATQLGGLSLYSWVFSSFLLAQTAMTVVFGKLADLFGRKPVMLAGIAIFLAGSVLAGFAWSMPVLIAFRLIQGIGAGAIQPVAMTIVGDLYPAHERGKVQGYLASVWAISAVVGPMVGGFIIHALSWAWIFWMNVPIGLAAAAGFVAFLHEQPGRRRPSIDIAGAALFTVAVAALMIALTDIGASADTHALYAGAVCVVAAVLFVLQERRAAEPMISFALWSRRPIAATNASTLLTGMVLMGVTTFLPIYVQGVLQRSPVVAGMALTMMMVGWPVGATLSARLFRRFNLRSILVVGSVFIPAGAAVFALMRVDSAPLTAGFGSLVMGFGMGLAATAALVLIQELVETGQRGSATASNLFARNLGSTLGATVFGAVFNFGLAHAKAIGAVTPEQLRGLLDASANKLAGGNEALRTALQQSLHLTFAMVLVVSVALLLLAMLVPAVVIRRAHEVTTPVAH
ncbi:MDR family MFS transporter [Paraburkholderia solisilvae]|uniref:MFS-type drug efflux transporter P55 n=1 Tax=Paraburkholderia solisilvae TaxID=624376 RepID=A0A6J5EAB6_9BURK|nr:MDR family MFS transporter [Paraburkholderia solisilvae]CAB3762092.1 Putative multidrug resistance protein MdtD [Paraburkholderia solisilvae]